MSRSERDPGCEQCGQAAAFVLGALGHEERDYREHLARCTICRSEVNELRAVIDAVPAAAAPADVSEELRDRVMAVVRSEAQLLRAAGPEADLPPRPNRSWRPGARSMLAGAAAVAAVMSSIVLTQASGPAERSTPAVIASHAPGAHAVLREIGDRGELVVSGMPAPPLGETYEVWIQRTRQAPSPTTALFTVTSKGRGSVDVPGSLRGVREVLVSIEPAGGSTHLSGRPVITVSVPT